MSGSGVRREKGGLVTVSPTQVAAWAPDTIITLDRGFRRSVAEKPAWKSVTAVSERHILLAPGLPFGFIDGPPSAPA
jgi:iron complex transport system substrate-binding protein